MSSGVPRISSPIDGYQIERLLGAGAHAEVFLALNSSTGSRVAIKLLRPELRQSVSAVRFLREIRYLRTLSHPNILPILDASEVDGVPYFVMPYVAGDSLRARIQHHGPLPLRTVLDVVRDLASALDYAHARNVIHRDLKPENILLDGERALLTDFGVARAMIASSSEESLSTSGIAIGTPSYMSPEQLLGETSVDGRCDIYSLGCVAYEMIAGEPPFAAASQMALASMHIAAPPRPLLSIRPEVTPEFQAAVFQALEKNAERRPRSGGEYASSLARAPTRRGT
jgi:serine/threonine-protein kinase